MAKRKFTKYPNSYVRADSTNSDYTTFSKQDWIDYISDMWRKEGVSESDLRYMADDLDCYDVDQWIDSIHDSLTPSEFRAFKKCFKVRDYEYVDLGDRQIYDRSEAYEWLQEKIDEYGDTYFWDDDLKSDLNRLTKKFGNTYFWR